nr:hypothetical protein BaRGS_023995 [Batillaria attramentaria]
MATSRPSPQYLVVDRGIDTDDELSDWDAPVDVDLLDPPVPRNKVGNFQAGDAGSVLKKLDSREHQCFQRLMHDRLQPFVPEYRGVVEKSGERYVQLQDLLCEFTSPCVMDIKMGVRTYLEEELEKARKKPTLRKDLYQKMISVDATAPTVEEQQQEAVTKPRYMRFRDDMSSTSSLGFRIEGIKTNAGSSKDYKDTRSRESVCTALRGFIGDTESVLPKYIAALSEIAEALQSSNFFKTNENWQGRSVAD